MPSKVKPIPEGYRSITPYLTIKDADKAIEFYKKAFDAKEIKRIEGFGGVIAHAELEIGDSLIMLCEESSNMGGESPEAMGGTTVTVHLYVPDVDATVEQAVAAGAMLKTPVKEQFYGDRSGLIADPFGHMWYISTHVEDVPEKEMHERMEAWKMEEAGRAEFSKPM